MKNSMRQLFLLAPLLLLLGCSGKTEVVTNHPNGIIETKAPAFDPFSEFSFMEVGAVWSSATGMWAPEINVKAKYLGDKDSLLVIQGAISDDSRTIISDSYASKNFSTGQTRLLTGRGARGYTSDIVFAQMNTNPSLYWTVDVTAEVQFRGKWHRKILRRGLRVKIPYPYNL